MPSPKKIELSFNYGAHLKFAWQMFFNRFTVEPDGKGKVVSFASVYEGQAKEIVPIRFSREALIQCRMSVEQYLPGLSGTEEAPSDTGKLPAGVKRFSNLFCNHIRLSHSGECAEVALYIIPMSLIADEILGRRKPKGDMPVVPVAMLHSDMSVHYRFINQLLDGIPAKFGGEEADADNETS